MVVPIRLDVGPQPSLFRISDQQPDAQLLRLEQGQVLTGRVVPGGQNGATRLLWSGYTFDLTLPQGAPPAPAGTQLQLRVVSTADAIHLQYVGQGFVQNTAIDPASRPGVQVSSVSQWLANLMEVLPLRAVNENGVDTSTDNTGLNALAPLRPTETTPSAEGLGQQLRQTIEKSGLFYESHQALWVQGRKAFESLLEEPQAKWSPTLASSANEAGGARNMYGVPNALVPHIERQLSVLEQQSVHWKGEVWPGVSMSWFLQPIDADALEDDTLRQQAKDDPDQRPWFTRFEVNLPELGVVHVHFQVYRDTVNWHLEAETPETTAILEQRRTEWTAALQARGISAIGEVLPWEEYDE